MIKINDYLYCGDTVLKILHSYSRDLKESAVRSHNQVDLEHVNYLLKITELLEHNDFLTSQSQRLREFYKYMADQYPFLAFTYKGRIKSLFRAEEKFNGNVVTFTQDYYRKKGTLPPMPILLAYLQSYHDLIAYRIVLDMPRCHLKAGEDQEEVNLRYLYEIAEILPSFLEERGFSPALSRMAEEAQSSSRLSDNVRFFYKDYIASPKPDGYQSLHINLYDNIARCSIEVQLRTKKMDDHAEIGAANHEYYEEQQGDERTGTGLIPAGTCAYYEEAVARVKALQAVDLSKVDVNMFAAVNNDLVNDGCGLYRGRLILPYEHLSRFQNDLIG